MALEMKRDEATGNWYGEKLPEEPPRKDAAAPRHDDHYTRLRVAPKGAVADWSRHWPSHVAHPLGEAVYKLARCGVKGSMRQDIEKAFQHVADALDILDE